MLDLDAALDEDIPDLRRNVNFRVKTSVLWVPRVGRIWSLVGDGMFWDENCLKFYKV